MMITRKMRVALIATVLGLVMVLTMFQIGAVRINAEEPYKVTLTNAVMVQNESTQTEKTYFGEIGKSVPIKETITGPVSLLDKGKLFGGFYTQTNGKGDLVTPVIRYEKASDGQVYSVDCEFSADKDTTLYAFWERGVTLSFDANEGTIGTQKQTRAKNIKVVDETFENPTRDRYIFKGWSESANGDNAFQLDEYIATKNATLYAVWEKDKQNGLLEGPDGKLAYYKDGKVDTSVTSVVKGADGWYRVKDGYVDWKANGIYKNEYGWWKTTNGKVTFHETGVFKNEYGWWRVENSKVDFNAQEIYQNEYGWWKTTNGKVTFKETGVFRNDYGWWRVEDSKVNFKFNGLAKNDYGWWYLKNGKVQFGYTGMGINSQGRWYVNKGKVDFNYDGKVEYKGITYTCTDGKVTGGTNSAETNAVKVLNKVGWDFKKAYYWTINNITYNKYVVPTDGSYGIVNYANHGFVQKSGNCYTFGCCVYFLGRMANEDIHVIKGSVPLRSGGYGPHCWNEVTRNGKKYVLDAQYEQKWRKAGRHPYSGWLFTYGTKGSLRYNISYRMD